MLTFTPLTRADVGNCPSVAIGVLFENEVSAVKAAIAKLSTAGVGKYGLSYPALTSHGYVSEGTWLGLHGFTTVQSFEESEHTQEQVMNKHLTNIYAELLKFGVIATTMPVSDLVGYMVAAYFMDVMPLVKVVRNKAATSEQLEFYMRVGSQASSVA
jgi:hypothetical protein